MVHHQYLTPVKETSMKITVETEELLSIPQAARLIGVTRVCAWYWARDGKMTTIVLGGQTLVPRSVAEEIKRKRDGDA